MGRSTIFSPSVVTRRKSCRPHHPRTQRPQQRTDEVEAPVSRISGYAAEAVHGIAQRCRGWKEREAEGRRGGGRDPRRAEQGAQRRDTIGQQTTSVSHTTTATVEKTRVHT